MGEVKEQVNIFPESIALRYRLKKKIGMGGMGDVYLVEDTRMGRDVALKAIRPELVENEEVRQRIERECKMHSAIPVHPHIVVLHEKKVGENGNIFLIMEYVDGENLSDLISAAKSANSTIPLKKIITIVTQVLTALSDIHKHDIVHRDIKPSNIIVSGWDTDEPCAKLMDFGIARDVIEDDNLTKLTMLDAGGPGTPAYMAPERIDSKTFGDICPATDLYSMGIIFYEMLCLEPPHSGTLTEIFAGHIAREPSFNGIQFLSESVQKVLNIALAKVPSERYESSQQFIDALLVLSCTSGNDETLLNVPFGRSIDKGETLLQTPNLAGSISRPKVIYKKIFSVLGVAVFLGILVSYYYIENTNFSMEKQGESIVSEEEKNDSEDTLLSYFTVKDSSLDKEKPITKEELREQSIDLKKLMPTQVGKGVVIGANDNAKSAAENVQLGAEVAIGAQYVPVRLGGLAREKKMDVSGNSGGSALGAFEAEMAKRKKNEQDRIKRERIKEEERLAVLREKQAVQEAVRPVVSKRKTPSAESKYIVIPIR